MAAVTKTEKFADLPRRTASALVAGPLALLAVWFGGAAFALLVGLLTVVGLWEWLRLQQRDPSLLCVVCSTFGLALAWFFADLQFYGFACLTLVVVAGCAHNLYERAQLENASWISFGLVYLGSAAVALLALAQEGGHWPTLFLLGIVWATDIGAYVTGRIVGGPKLAPAISPGKTWSGLLGGVAAAAAVAWAFGQQQLSPVVGMLPNIGCGAGLAIAAQGGDLLESWLKRRAGVKDSGRFLPGHGGLLDRIDGLLPAAVLLVISLSAMEWADVIWRFAGQSLSAI